MEELLDPFQSKSQATVKVHVGFGCGYGSTKSSHQESGVAESGLVESGVSESGVVESLIPSASPGSCQ